MNVRSLPSVALGDRGDPLPARLIPLASGLCAVLFDTPPGPRASRLEARLDGAAAPRPSFSTRLELRSGGWRHTLILGLDAAEVARRRVTLGAGGVTAAIEPDWLASPIARPRALTEGLTEAAAGRLIRLVLSATAALPGGVTAAERLATVLGLFGLDPLPCRVALPLGAAGHVLIYRLSGDTRGLPGELLIPGGPGRDPRLSAHVEGCDLFLFLPGRPPEAGVIGLGSRRVWLAPPAPELPRRALIALISHLPASARAWAMEIIAAEAVSDAGAAAIRRELDHAGPAPAARLTHLSATPGGLLLALDLDDPARLVGAVSLERGEARVTLPVPPGGRLATFAPLPGSGQVAVRLLHRSGRRRLVSSGPVRAYGGEAPPGFHPAEAGALARARAALPARRVSARVLAHNLIEAPRFALIAPVGADLDTIPARAALLSRAPGAGRVETIYHAAEGPLAEAAAETLAETAAIHGAPARLVILREDASETERLVAALTLTRAPRMALLGAAVMPDGPGWLGAAVKATAGMRPALRAGLLFDPEGALIEAGGADAAGLPAALLPSRVGAAATPTADCALLNHAAAEAFHTLASAYPNPRVVLALLAARLGAAGAPARLAKTARFVRYAEPPRMDPLETAIEAAALADALRGIGG